MFSMIKTSGFVIKKHDFREYDRIYTIYTQALGKIPVFVRSARKIKSKLSPGLENFDEVQINFIKGRIFNHLTGWRTIEKNCDILKKEERIFTIYDCLYLLDRLVKENESDDNIFVLIRNVIKAINNDYDAQKIKIYFFWRLIDLLGYRPRLESCALCGLETGFDTRFNITDNIIICRKCEGQGIFIKENTLTNLRAIFHLSLSEFLNKDMSAQLAGITSKAKEIKLSEL